MNKAVQIENGRMEFKLTCISYFFPSLHAYEEFCCVTDDSSIIFDVTDKKVYLKGCWYVWKEFFW